MPHNGTEVPDAIAARMTEAALQLPDTDWHMDRLYGFADQLRASVIKPIYSRYVIDLNRPPDGKALYPGSSNTELCPLTCFDFSPVYKESEAPDEAEVAERTWGFWRPYHIKIRDELARIRERHGIALLYEAHSIRSQVPRFFDGVLPDLNLGSADGKSCAPALEAALAAFLQHTPEFSSVVNARFKGGYITRTYGKPQDDVHAVQLELSQATYMEEQPPFGYRDELAEKVQPTLKALLTTMLEWAEQQKASTK